MNLRRFFLYTTVCFLATAAATASAQSITSTIGDRDGFGIGLLDGQVVDFALVGPTDVQGTDTRVIGSRSIVHDYALPASFESAALELFTGGQGFYALSGVYLNGTLIGTLTDGDIVTAPFNYAWRDTFDLTPHLGLLTGHDTVEIRTASIGDVWVLDYSELTLVSAVPEPSTHALLALGLAALGLAARRAARRAPDASPTRRC